MKNILIFFGGVSQEHGISIITGVLTTNSLDKTKFNAIPIYIDEKGEWWTGEKLKDVAFFKNFSPKKLSKVCLLSGDNYLYKIKNGRLKRLFAISAGISALHGKNGEDGAICGLCQLSDIPLSSPNMFCSALAIDKVMTKKVLKGLDILAVPSAVVSKSQFAISSESVLLDLVNQMNLPLIVKPRSSGSSIGISIARTIEELETAINLALKYDYSAIVEKYIEGAVDINCAVYQAGEVVTISPCEKPLTNNEILTFADKYKGSKNGLSKEFPADITTEESERITAITRKVYSELEFSGIVRIDYLLSGGVVYLNEINAVPGSLAYYLFCDKLSAFTDLLTDLLTFTMIKYEREKTDFTQFNSKSVIKEIKGSKS